MANSATVTGLEPAKPNKVAASRFYLSATPIASTGYCQKIAQMTGLEPVVSTVKVLRLNHLPSGA